MMRRRFPQRLLVLILFVFFTICNPLFVWAAPSAPVAAADDWTTGFSAERVYEHIRHLSQEIGPRPAGSKNEHKAAEYLFYVLEQAGWKVREQPFSKIVANPNPLIIENRVQVINSQNIIAELPGKSPETILLGAHYDTADLSAPGAVDNASGVGVLLELARILGESQHEQSYQIVFFGAEENGLVGSSYFATQSDLSVVQWMLNLDMIGTPLEIDIAGKKSAPPELVSQIVKTARSAELPFHVSRDFVVMTRDGIQGGNSDFSPFLEQGIPAVGLGIAGRADGYLHRPEDRLEQVNMQELEEIGRFIPRLLDSVHIEGTGSKSWDDLYLPFQLGSWVFILPTLALRGLFILVIFFTGYMMYRGIKQRENQKEPLRNYWMLIAGIPVAALLVSAFSGAGEWLWQNIKGKELIWSSYPGLFVTIRLLIAIFMVILLSAVLSKIPRPRTRNLTWLIGNGMLLLLIILLGLYRIDLAFPFIFWSVCYNLLYFFPSLILVILGPYFIYKTHWELLNSEQWPSFYQTLHQYPLLFIVLYALLLIPVFLAGLYIIEKRRWPWPAILKRLQIPAVAGLALVILGMGMIPVYTKNYPQPVAVQTIWTGSQEARLKISSQDSLPQTLLDEFNLKEGKTIEVSVPNQPPPLKMEVGVSPYEKNQRKIGFTMNYQGDPYLVRIKLESQKPFQIVQMDEFLPVAKLPRKIALEGKEQNGTYSLTLERTPPHKTSIQWGIAANGVVKCTVEVLFADSDPKMIIQDPRISSTYEKIYRTEFEF